MADKEVSDLTDGGAVQSGDIGHIVRSGNSRKVTFEAQLPATRASSSGPASLQLHEDTDNGTHKYTLQAPAALAGDVTETAGGGKGSAIASTTTITIGGEKFYHVTGATTITDIDFTSGVDGTWAWLEFDGALTLTHNATTLNLPGGTNILTAAGDRALVVQDNGDNVHVLAYIRASGAPVAPGTVVGSAFAEYTAATALTTVLPLDDTIPTSTEGTEIHSISYTPKQSGNKLLVEFQAFGANSTVDGSFNVALFAGTTCIGASTSFQPSGSTGNPIACSAQFTTVSGSAVTISSRVGPGANTAYLNANFSGTRRFGGAAKATLKITEIQA